MDKEHEILVSYRDALCEAGFLQRTTVDGVYGRSALFERLVGGVEAYLSGAGADQSPTVVRFPPVVPLELLVRSGYLGSFPTLVGSIRSFKGNEDDHRVLLAELEEGERWSSAATDTGNALCPAACHPLYPTLAGGLPPSGRVFDVYGYVFRHEPSVDPARMQIFRQYEFVYVGDSLGATSHRDLWLERAFDVLGALGLEVTTQAATDPFFGRTGRLLADSQRLAGRKTEFLARTSPSEMSTALASVNLHADHFGRAFGIRSADGTIAHSACVGFGVERIVLALLYQHGLDPTSWPSTLRERLTT